MCRCGENGAINLRNADVVVFGLGHHGGGVAAAQWCVRHGARVTVYDRQPAHALRASIAKLRHLPIALQCGDNNPYAIRKADMVIKNPAVPRHTVLLQEAQRIETDLSLLLYHAMPKTIAVTGTKGKSSTVSAIDYALSQLGIVHATAGNIGVSIFDILDTLGGIDVLLLELSSFQLGDLVFVREFNRQKTHMRQLSQQAAHAHADAPAAQAGGASSAMGTDANEPAAQTGGADSAMGADAHATTAHKDTAPAAHTDAAMPHTDTPAAHADAHTDAAMPRTDTNATTAHKDTAPAAHADAHTDAAMPHTDTPAAHAQTGGADSAMGADANEPAAQTGGADSAADVVSVISPQWPDVAICTNIYPDHLDYYSTMDEYICDKYPITMFQKHTQWLLLPGGITQTQCRNAFMQRTEAQVVLVGDELQRAISVAENARTHADTATTVRADEAAVHTDTTTTRTGTPAVHTDAEMATSIAATVRILPDRENKNNIAVYDDGTIEEQYALTTAALGDYNRYNLAMAYTALRCVGVLAAQKSQDIFCQWTGIANRMELVGESRNIRFINDTAATIPEATYRAIKGIDVPIYLIAGGSDKNIALDIFLNIADAVRDIFFLDGSATKRIVALFDTHQRPYQTPFSSLKDAFDAAVHAILRNTNTDRQKNSTRTDNLSRSADACNAMVLLSPGCASFGMFKHEFERGQQYRELVAQYLTQL